MHSRRLAVGPVLCALWSYLLLVGAPVRAQADGLCPSTGLEAEPGGAESGEPCDSAPKGALEEEDVEIEAGPGTDAWVDDWWMDSWYGNWDPAFDTWWSTPRSLALSLAMGRRTFQRFVLDESFAVAPRWGAEWYGLLSLNVPLAALFSSRRATHRMAPVRPPSSSSHRQRASVRERRLVTAVTYPSRTSAEGSSQVPLGREYAGPTLAPDDAPAAQRSAPSAMRPEERSLLRLVARTVEATRRAFETSSDRDRWAGMLRRARVSGAVPEVRLRGVVGIDRTTSSEDAIGIYPGETTTRGGRDSLVEARLTFRLDRLVFGSQEPSLARQLSQQELRKAERIESAVQAVQQWYQTVLASARSDLTDEERFSLFEQQQSHLVRAHLLTGGWFEGTATLRRLNIAFPTRTLSSSRKGGASEAARVRDQSPVVDGPAVRSGSRPEQSATQQEFSAQGAEVAGAR